MSLLLRVSFAAYAAVFFFACIAHVNAASLTLISDVVSSSANATSTSHSIQFTVSTSIPASGKIVVTFEDNAFTIPLSFDYTDVDVAVSTGGPFSDRNLGTTATAAIDGVSVNTTTDIITITLNSTSGIGIGDVVLIELGDIATSGATGDQLITNPATTGSYRIAVETKDASDVLLDAAKAMIAVIETVGAHGFVLSSAPTRFNGLPSGEIEAGNSNIEISLNTDEAATCRFSTASTTPYTSMTETFSVWNASSTIFHKTVTGHVDGTTYSYFVRCMDTDGKMNDDDFEILFSLKPTPEFDTSVTAPFLGVGGVGPFPNGSAFLYLSSMTISGWSSPQNSIAILKDGKSAATGQTASDGSFKVTASGFERGTYTFLTYAVDRTGKKSAGFSSTIALGQGTNNVISNIVLPPTIGIEDVSVAVGDPVVFSGETVPGSSIELSVGRTGTSAASFQRYSATTTPGSGGGKWEISLPNLARGTYLAKAQTTRAGGLTSNFSSIVFFGVGEEPSEDFSVRADLNGDGKVNLTDFSILLSFWGTDDENADINSDGVVNLADVSILLFNWTG